MLLHAAVSGEASDPPAAAADGECWLVGPSATGEWSGNDGSLAGRQAGSWVFAAPLAGMRAYDLAAGQSLLYTDQWRRSGTPNLPTGGTVIDTEARDTIATLIEALRVAGVFVAA